jgi:hypothetical protein
MIALLTERFSFQDIVKVLPGIFDRTSSLLSFHLVLRCPGLFEQNKQGQPPVGSIKTLPNLQQMHLCLAMLLA